ncbi:MAG TPA: DUF6691 family protein [Candidatus Binatia bacterium]|jgi:uncharacterized membrane protein YedE/YeeE|nr:DUF6691 family protein [Candidatus Binatia bacterium]
MTRNRLLTFLIGIYFGIVLVKSQVVAWNRIHAMFLLQSPYMYLVISSAIAVGALSLLIIRRANLQVLGGSAVVIKRKPFHKGVVFGGTLFGMGWAITGACPGPIYAQMGSGTFMALFTFIGALGGMYLYAFLQPKLPHTSWGFIGTRRGSAGASS